MTKPDYNEIATTHDGRDITRPYIGPLLKSQDDVLKARGTGGLSIYQQTRSDPQIAALLAVRRRALISKDLIIEPGGPARRDRIAADSLRAQLTALNFDRITSGMHWAVWYGYGVGECIYTRADGEVVLSDIRVRDRGRFRFDRDRRLRMLTQKDSIDGELMPDRKFWVLTCGADHDDDPYGLGLAHYLYWPAYFSRHGMRAWIRFLDKFSIPTAIGRYKDNTDQAEQIKLLAAIQSLQSDSGAVMPESMRIEFLELAKSGTTDFERLQVYFDQLKAKVIVGQVMTTEAIGGQYKAEVQSEVALNIVESDDDLMSESFCSSVARWLTQWNYPGAAVPLVYREVRPQDIEIQAKRDKSIMELGLAPSEPYLKKTYGEDWSKPTEQNSPDFRVLQGGALPESGVIPSNRIATGLQRVASDLGGGSEGHLDGN